MNGNLERLDKAIAAQTDYSRRDVHRLLSRGQVLVNGVAVRAFDAKADLEHDTVEVAGRTLRLSRFCYLMMNKPRGVVCATEDAALPTVLDLVPPELRRSRLFPAGRLDKDTEGFVLLTNDGDFAHRILSPKSHVPKTYFAELDGPVTAEMTVAFADGVALPPERAGEKPRTCMPASLCAAGLNGARVVIRQGVYHQIKRMFAACGRTVVSLRREKIGALLLDSRLAPGACRALTQEELRSIESGGDSL